MFSKNIPEHQIQLGIIQEFSHNRLFVLLEPYPDLRKRILIQILKGSRKQ